MRRREPSKNYTYVKVLLLGERGVGKTSLFRIFSGTEYDEHAGDVGLPRHTKTYSDLGIKMDMWDMRGEIRTYITEECNFFYRNTRVVVYVYNPLDLSSLEELMKQMSTVQYHVHNSEDIQSFFVATHSDSLMQERMCNLRIGGRVNYVIRHILEQIKDAMDLKRSMTYEVSCKNPKDVEVMFRDIAFNVMKNDHKNKHSKSRSEFKATEKIHRKCTIL